MNSGHYVSCVGGVPRSGDPRHLSDQAIALGYDVWTIGDTESDALPMIWFVKAVRYAAAGDVIYIKRLCTAYEWNGLTARFRIAMTKGE